MKFLLISDTHLKHENMRTYCDRPSNFTELIIKKWNERVQPEDTVLHLGDVAIGAVDAWRWIIPSLPGKKILIRGNHDRARSLSWWCDNGFDFACDGLMFRGWWLTHEPVEQLPKHYETCQGNIHGHLHNIWHGFAPNAGAEEAATRKRRLRNSWQRLFAVEYTNYAPIEFDEFVFHPDRYQARGPNEKDVNKNNR